MEYGKMIANLRKSHGMTQAELGNSLNVTYQAVSKWERDESYPDFETLSKIAKIFGVPISYFENGIIPSAQESVAAVSPINDIAGICTVCGKALRSTDVAEKTPALVCIDCKQRLMEEKIKAERDKEQEVIRIEKDNKEKAERQKNYEKASARRIRNRGLIAGGIAAVAMLIVMIVGCVVTGEADIGLAIGGTAVVTVLAFTFVSQLFWKGIILDIALWGFKTIGMPGVIFTLDLDGIIFLIAVKILFAILKLLLLALTVLLGFIIAAIVSLFTFIPCFIKLSRGKELD